MFIRGMDDFEQLPARLMQGNVNALVLMRLATGDLLLDPAMVDVGGRATSITAQAPGFYGISLGGILGALYMSVSTQVDKGVLLVPGSPFSLLLPRSGLFAPLALILRARFDNIDITQLLTVAQLLLDRSMFGGFSDGLDDGRFANGLKHRVLIQYGKGDAQVSWVGALQMGRSVGNENDPENREGRTQMYSSNIQVGNETFYGFATVDDGASIRAHSAIIGTDFGAPLDNIPFDNNPAASSTDSHGKVFGFLPMQAQAGAFLLNGEITNTCGGPCVDDKAPEDADAEANAEAAQASHASPYSAAAARRTVEAAVAGVQATSAAVVTAAASSPPSPSSPSSRTLSATAARAKSVPASQVHVEQFGECQCPMTSSWFNAFYDACLKGNPAMLKLVNFTQYVASRCVTSR